MCTIERVAALYAIEKEVRGKTPELRRRCGRLAPRRCSRARTPGLKPRSRSSRISPIPPRRSAMRSRSGALSRASSKIGHWRSTTTQLNVLCATSRSGARTSCSPAQIKAASAPRLCTHCSAPPSSTASIQRSTFIMCSIASLTTPSAASRNSCLGTCQSLPL